MEAKEAILLSPLPPSFLDTRGWQAKLRGKGSRSLRPVSKRTTSCHRTTAEELLTPTSVPTGGGKGGGSNSAAGSLTGKLGFTAGLQDAIPADSLHQRHASGFIARVPMTAVQLAILQ